jgi:hypothetical protein
LCHLDVLGVSWTFILYSGVCAVAFVFIFSFVPETKNRSLEQISSDLSQGWVCVVAGQKIYLFGLGSRHTFSSPGWAFTITHPSIESTNFIQPFLELFSLNFFCILLSNIRLLCKKVYPVSCDFWFEIILMKIIELLFTVKSSDTILLLNWCRFLKFCNFFHKSKKKKSKNAKWFHNLSGKTDAFLLEFFVQFCQEIKEGDFVQKCSSSTVLILVERVNEHEPTTNSNSTGLSYNDLSVVNFMSCAIW